MVILSTSFGVGTPHSGQADNSKTGHKTRVISCIVLFTIVIAYIVCSGAGIIINVIRNNMFMYRGVHRSWGIGL